VHVFDLESAELGRLDLDSSLTILDVGSLASWYRIEDLRAGSPPLYPAGVLDLLP
jgi:hypothetical protein